MSLDFRVKMPEIFELHQFVNVSQHKENSGFWLTRIRNQLNCPYLGIVLATLSSLFFSLCSVIVKRLIDVNPIELAAFR